MTKGYSSDGGPEKKNVTAAGTPAGYLHALKNE